MTNDSIEKFIETKAQKNPKINIHFKQRATVKGVFIRTNDFNELKSKNFWRIVSDSNVAEWPRYARHYHDSVSELLDVWTQCGAK